MTYLNRLLSLLILTGLISSCSYLGAPPVKYQNRDVHYLDAKTIAPLKFPPGTSSSTVENYYPVSDKSYPENTKLVPLTPPGLEDKS